MSTSDLPAEAVQAAQAICQAFDMGYPRECTQRARYRAEKHQALPFDLCGQHLNRAWRAGYQVREFDLAGECSTPVPVQAAPHATQDGPEPRVGMTGCSDDSDPAEPLSALPDEVELIELTVEEYEAALANELARLGCTYDELVAMSRTGEYASPDHRLLWLRIKPAPSAPPKETPNAQT